MTRVAFAAAMLAVLAPGPALAASGHRVRIDVRFGVEDGPGQKDVLASMYRACADLADGQGVSSITVKQRGGGSAWPRTYNLTISFPAGRTWVQGLTFAGPDDVDPRVDFSNLRMMFTSTEVDAVRPVVRISVDLVARFTLEDFEFEVVRN